jgi:hypothetical protein
MSTIVNGQEITSDMAEILKDWLNGYPGDSYLELYIKWCGNIQDIICRIIVDDDINEDMTKERLNEIMTIKDQLTLFAKAVIEKE